MDEFIILDAFGLCRSGVHCLEEFDVSYTTVKGRRTIYVPIPTLIENVLLQSVKPEPVFEHRTVFVETSETIEIPITFSPKRTYARIFRLISI